MARHEISNDDWAHDVMQQDRRRPLILGVIGLIGVALVIAFIIYTIASAV